MILAAPEELHEFPFSCHILEVSALLGAGLCRLSQWGSRTNAGMCTTNSSRKVEARDSDLLLISFYCLLLNLCPFMSYWCKTYPGLLNFHPWFLAVSFFSLLVLWSSVQPRLPWQSFHVVLPGTPEESQPCCIMKARKSKMAFPVDTAPLNFWPVYHWKSTQVTRFSITSRRSGRSRVRLCARLTYGWTGFGDSTTSCSFFIFFPYVEKKHLGRDSQFELQVDFLCHVHKLVQNKQDWQTGAATSTLPMRFCPQVF